MNIFFQTSNLLTPYFINILYINNWFWKNLRRHGRIASITEQNAKYFYMNGYSSSWRRKLSKKFTNCCGVFWYIYVTHFIATIPNI